MLSQDKTGSELVTADLITDQVVVMPGQAINIGVRLKMEPGWHTYWLNPGDSGLATQVSWKLPEGFAKPRSLRWPTPLRLEAGGLTSYGFEGTAVAIASLRVPATAAPGSEFTITAGLDWFVCKETCFTGSGKAALSLKVGSKDQLPPITASPLTAAFKRLPQRANQIQFAARATEDHVILDVHLPNNSLENTSGIYFYAETIDLVDASAQQSVEKTDFGLRIFLPKSEYAVDNPNRLKGILTAPVGKTWLGLNNLHSIVVNALLKPTG